LSHLMKHVLLATLLAIVSFPVFANSSDVLTDQEYLDAVQWMYSKSITKYNNWADFSPHHIVLREHAAKFFTEFSVNMMYNSIDTAEKDCDFKDLIQWDPTLTNSILNACYLDIFYGNRDRFYPTQPLTKAEAIVALVRTLDGKQVETNESIRRKNYTKRANELGVSKETDASTQDRVMSRYEMALLLYRAKETIK